MVLHQRGRFKAVSRHQRAVHLGRRATALILVFAVLAYARPGLPATGAQGTPSDPVTADTAELSKPFMQKGHTADGIEIDLILATPDFFRLTDRWQEALDLGADAVVVVVFNIHHHGALDDDDTIVPILHMDHRSYHVPSEVRHLADDGHHRSDALIFSDLPTALLTESHILDILLPPGPEGTRPTFRWLTPIEDPAMMFMATPMPEASPMAIATPTALEAPLTRSGHTGEGTAVDVMLTPPWFFRVTNRLKDAQAYGADRFLVFVVSEHHYHGAPPLAPVLRVDGEVEYAPTEVRVLSEDGHHHRTSLLVFSDLPVSALDETHTLELSLPPNVDGSQDVLVWETPLKANPATPPST